MFGRKSKEQEAGQIFLINNFIIKSSNFDYTYKLWGFSLKKMKYVGHMLLIKEKRNSYKRPVGKSEGNGQPEKRRRWEDNIKMCLNEIGFEVVD